MIFSIIVLILSVLGLFILVIKFPKMKIFNHEIDTFWIPPFIGAILLIIFNAVTPAGLYSLIDVDKTINPVKIIVLFLSLSFISIVLDEAGFFKYLAIKSVNKAKGDNFKLFVIIYLLTSLLTIFTSNDIIILTFTPFILYFCHEKKINPFPYLFSEFIAANTWSLFLMIGNPTNIYLAESFEISFVSYLTKMALPTIAAGITSFLILLLLFRKNIFNKSLVVISDLEFEQDKTLTIVGLCHLIICTIMLIISGYIGFPIWIICLVLAISLLIFTIIYSVIKKKNYAINSLKRAPWVLIPFVISMFIIVTSLKENNITSQIYYFLNNLGNNNLGIEVFVYGLASMIGSNIINNIPATVLFVEVLSTESISLDLVYACVVGSNIGAFLTPIGALAGIMWMSLLSHDNEKISFLKFMKYGTLVAIPTILVALLVIWLL